MEETFIICCCNSPEHQIIFKRDESSDQPYIYANVHLSKKSFIQRFIHGIKYIFGYKSKYGAWDEIVIGPEHVEGFKNIYFYLQKLSPVKTLWKKENPRSQGVYLSKSIDSRIEIAYFNGNDWIELWGPKKLEIKEWTEIPQ